MNAGSSELHKSPTTPFTLIEMVAMIAVGYDCSRFWLGQGETIFFFIRIKLSVSDWITPEMCEIFLEVLLLKKSGRGALTMYGLRRSQSDLS